MFKAPFYNVSPLQPPGFVFSAAWLLIYPLIGVSGIILLADQPQLATLWLIQLVVNLAWVPGLFLVKNLWFSLLHLVVLLVLVLVIFYYANINVKMLWSPYLIWLLYAAGIFIDTTLRN
jgi:tryptophan-rich sensory protein